MTLLPPAPPPSDYHEHGRQASRAAYLTLSDQTPEEATRETGRRRGCNCGIAVRRGNLRYSKRLDG